MKVLFFGDVVGRLARETLCDKLPQLRQRFEPDFIAVNAENSAGGFGVTPQICHQLIEAGTHCITTGDHVWDQDTLAAELEKNPALVRAANFPPRTPGRGIQRFQTAQGQTVVVLHLMGQVFMKEHLDSPFTAADKALEPYTLGKNCQAILVDIHGEATSEKMAMAHYLDGRVSLVVGTHTHIPTNDAQILEGGTAYQTDLGMCGDYNSVIGFKKEAPLKQFLYKRRGRMSPAMSETTLCGVMAKIDTQTGHALSIEPFKVGGRIA